MGYGKRFQAAGDHSFGRKQVWDCIAAKQFLITSAHVAPDRVGVYGVSYGGFLALAALFQYPTDFKAAIDMFGVTDWVTTLGSIPPYWETFRALLTKTIGDPITDRVALQEASPINHAAEIKTPLLVIHGAGDPRVPANTVDIFVNRVRTAGGTIQYLKVGDEGHGLTSKQSQFRVAEAIKEFVGTYLLTQ
jgi:dipeptidyl aminopeptidase/acylaminoacyl peptidase